MSGENKTLFLFTAGYPYGTRDEPFLENEIEYLSGAFDKVVVIPHHKPSSETRKTPENVVVNDCLVNADLSNKKRYFFVELLFVLRIVLRSAKSFKRIKSFWKNHRLLLDIIAISIVHGKTLLREFKDLDLESVVFYDYWFANAIFSISFLKRKRKIKKFICRAHRYDIYEDNWPTTNVPFFEHKISVVDELYFISKHGLEHVKRQTPERFTQKLKISYLGVRKPTSKMPQKSPQEVFTIISCARVVDFKRVHLIPLVLKNIKSPIKWIHFGDGPLSNELQENCNSLPKNITVELAGHVSNKHVHQFYENNHVDLFLSISLSEGLPVSMMEALSYGVPIIAVDAGGIYEIVTNKTGVLLEHEKSLQEISDEIEEFIAKNEFSKEQVKTFFDNHFSAEMNYRKFVLDLKSNK